MSNALPSMIDTLSQPQPSRVIGLQDLRAIIKNQDDMREVLIRDGHLIPSKKSALSSNAFYRGVFQGTIWTPHQSRLQLRQCYKPPSV